MNVARHVMPLLLVLVLFATTQCYGVFRTRWRAGHPIWACSVAISIVALWLNFGAVIYLVNAR